MTQLSCKRDTTSKGHPGMKLAPMRVFSCKHPLSFYTLCLLPVCLPFMSAYPVCPLTRYVFLPGYFRLSVKSGTRYVCLPEGKHVVLPDISQCLHGMTATWYVCLPVMFFKNFQK